MKRKAPIRHSAKVRKTRVYADEFEVEDILAKKTTLGQEHYLIKWKGYSIHECTWEPWHHLINVGSLLEKFNDNQINSPNRTPLTTMAENSNFSQRKTSLQCSLRIC